VVYEIENLAVVRLTIAEQKHDLFVKDYRNQRVITLKEVDTLHCRVDGTARRNFNDNRKHFIEGEDFFVRNSYEAKTEFGITAPNGLTLLTESGYLMLVKSFTDDLAWQVQRQLVKHYFRGKVSSKPTKFPWADDMNKALRQDAKLTKDLSKVASIRLRASTLRQVQGNTGHNYSELIAILEADADAQERKIAESEARAEQKRIETEAKAARKEAREEAKTPTGQAKAALEWLREEYAKKGEKLAHIQDDHLLVRYDLWKLWAGNHRLNLTMILRELHKQDIVELLIEGDKPRYALKKRIEGKPVSFVWVKRDKINLLEVV